ncbi:probable amidase At4g34880 [Cynara cardunculus var. scolymus]|uniref:probable amidase At4g34880 n=1 Tax=Cynara cardunculus var. scolymus TaxID=59895 RepID=UPI000D62EB2C|nr:probable amidase At4g34880 [Cynara cardunculus var. scolymus]
MIKPILLLILLFQSIIAGENSDFTIREATIQEIQTAFNQKKLTSKGLVEFYIEEITKLNPIFRAVIELNPDAVRQAEKADQERETNTPNLGFGMHGIPILLKDNIATKDKLNTTAGSYALLKSVVPQDAYVVKKLRESGAIILGKASMSEWAHFRSSLSPSGWNARAKQAVNPYVATVDPCGSSTGSAISVATNMVTVSLGTETDGSILCPSSANSVVGIKPTVGLTSRAGVIPVSPRQDTIGPICRTVADAVYVLDAIVGFDNNDAVATQEASQYIPKGGYLKHLISDGLKGKRLGIMRAYPYFGFANDTKTLNKFEKHFAVLSQSGATLVENLEIIDLDHIVSMFNSEFIAILAEFKIALNAYQKELMASPVRSLADVITFNEKFADLEELKKYPQDFFLAAEETGGIGELEKEALMNLTRASKNGFEKLMKKNKLDALVTPYSHGSTVLAIGGYPGISVPSGYDDNGAPYGICFQAASEPGAKSPSVSTLSRGLGLASSGAGRRRQRQHQSTVVVAVARSRQSPVASSLALCVCGLSRSRLLSRSRVLVTGVQVRVEGPLSNIVGGPNNTY